VARQTIYEYLEFLNSTYFISLLPAIEEVDVSLRKQKKVYLIDTGFFSFLSNVPRSSILENAVYKQLRGKGEIFYFQKNNQEIDFLLKTTSGERIAFEVIETATPSDIKGLKKITSKQGIKEGFVISLNYREEDGIKYLFQLPDIKSNKDII